MRNKDHLSVLICQGSVGNSVTDCEGHHAVVLSGHAGEFGAAMESPRLALAARALDGQQFKFARHVHQKGTISPPFPPGQRGAEIWGRPTVRLAANDNLVPAARMVFTYGSRPWR